MSRLEAYGLVGVCVVLAALLVHQLRVDTEAELGLREACGRVEARSRACAEAVAQCGALLERERDDWRSVRVDAVMCGGRAAWVHYGRGGPQVSCDASVEDVP